MYSTFHLCLMRPCDSIQHENIHEVLHVQNYLLHSVTLIKTKFFQSVYLNIRKRDFLPRQFKGRPNPNKIALRRTNKYVPSDWEKEEDNSSKRDQSEEDEDNDKQKIPIQTLARALKE